MTDRDRDLSVERWLRQTPVAGARSESAESLNACLDAETLAAWADGVLSGPERSSAEAHASNCARCQVMLAVMVRTIPGPIPRLGSPIRKWLMMLGPAAAATAAVALWFAVDQRPTPSVIDELSKGQAKAERAAEVAHVAPPPAAGAEKEVDSKVPGSSLERDAPKVTDEARRELGDRAGTRTSADARATTAPGNERKERKDLASAKRADKPLDAERLRAAAEPAALPPSSQPPPARPAAAEGVQVAAATPPVVVAPPGPAPQQQANQASNQNQAQTQSQNQARQQAVGALEERVIVSAERPLGRAAGADTGAAGRGGVAGAFDDGVTRSYRMNAATLEVVVRESSVRWRVVDGRTVQRSVDAGATWANQYSAEDGVTLTAGAAPSSTVCWLVGRSGAIVLTTNGRVWQRVKFPEPVDLTSVTSLDARTATVTTANGRSFVTTDRGRSWTPR